MSCREFVDFLLDYLSGQLPPAQRAAFEEHLAACPDCQAYLSTYRSTVALSKRAFDQDTQPGEGAPEELVRAVLAARQK